MGRSPITQIAYMDHDTDSPSRILTFLLLAAVAASIIGCACQQAAGAHVDFEFRG
jgi:hypothetical protein